MITRQHQQGETASFAVYSDCETYRYRLSRIWDRQARQVMFVMLNPSRATEVQNDPTIERCERRARALGYGGFCATNIFAFRATDPRDMRNADDPEGPQNTEQLLLGAETADVILCAWGAHGAHRDQGRRIAALLQATQKPLLHLGLTAAGHPRHPLYIAYRTAPAPWHELSAWLQTSDV